MAIQKIDIDTFIDFSKDSLVLDVRSPSEFHHAHFPGAYSLPLFSDDQRKVVGTAYKQKSKEIAIKIGLDYFGPKMRHMIEELEGLLQNNKKKILVYCWRGGMRSGGVSWLLDLYGFEVYQLIGGYKSFRNWVLARFETPYNFNVIGGFTGSGKTYLLHTLSEQNHQIIDLEALASHKGSALGGINQKPQASQEMFENILADRLSKLNSFQAIYIEDESQRIGNLIVPKALWTHMKHCKMYLINIPFEERLEFLLKEYGLLPFEDLKNAILRIQKRLGGMETKNAIQFLEDNNVKECFRILLFYYDKWYTKGISEKKDLITINCQSVNALDNLELLLKHT